jgi:arginine N-succinyltransferase
MRLSKKVPDPTPNVLIRPIAQKDLDPLLSLLRQAEFGLTTLPKDRNLLKKRILDSEWSFQRIAEEPRGETYLFVMEDLDARKIVGISGIISKVGGFEPFYSFKIDSVLHESLEIKVRQNLPILTLVAEHNGPCEIGSLFLAPEYRKAGLGRFLSVSRFLFMASHQSYFDPMVVAEMRGVIDAEGRSPFWDALGKHFFKMDFPRADFLSILNKRFIADLIPTHPIYIPLLPVEAQAVIGQVHKNTKPALKILKKEGFRFKNRVDIFEGGPLVSCPLEKIRSVRTSVQGTVLDLVSETQLKPIRYLISNGKQNFYACLGPLKEKAGQVILSSKTALKLRLLPGDSVYYCPFDL